MKIQSRIALHRFCGMRQSEIAESLSVSQQVVSYHLAQLRKRTQMEGVMDVFFAISEEIQESRENHIAYLERDIRQTKPDFLIKDVNGEDLQLSLKYREKANLWEYMMPSVQKTQTNYQNQMEQILKIRESVDKMMNEISILKKEAKE